MLELAITVGLLVVAYFWGSHVEKKHYDSLQQRERNLPKIPVIQFNRHQFEYDVDSVKMISGSVVLGADYFKTVLSGLINIFGGNISVLESVLERARREAVLRMRDKAPTADFIADVRFETTEIFENSKKSAPKIEIYAYATAIYLRKHAV